MHGAIRDTWFAAFDKYVGGTGMPVNDAHPAPDNKGKVQDFERMSIYQTPAGAAFEMRGATFALWKSMGWANSWLKFPQSAEMPIPADERNVHQVFEGGVIFFTEKTGAYALHKQIRVTYLNLNMHNDHDGVASGEWQVDMYANDHRVSLTEGTELYNIDDGDCSPHRSDGRLAEVANRKYGGGFGVLLAMHDIESCDRYWQGKYVNVDLPISQGKLRVFSVGYEEDTATTGKLPDLGPTLKGIPTVGPFVQAGYDLIRTLRDYDQNDGIGLIDHTFTAENRFGVGGVYSEKSKENPAAGDLADNHETINDWTLQFRIDEVIPQKRS